MLSLKLFNAVLVSEDAPKSEELFLKDTLRYGFILQPEVAALLSAPDVIKYLQRQVLNGEQMNQTFHKSWAKIENSTRAELLAHQLMHYFSTYGLQNLGLYSHNTIYIPAEVLEVPELKEDLPLKIIKGYTREELVGKCMELLESGIALKGETIDDILTLLDELEYIFTTIDNIKNKEAKLMISDKFGILPSNNTEFIRYLIYKATGSTLLINDRTTLKAIEYSGLDIHDLCMQYGLEKLSESFLRYKNIFLAFKRGQPQGNPYIVGKLKHLKGSGSNAYIVNRLRRLAKKHHKPMPLDYLNNFTGMIEFDQDELNEQLSKVNNFRKIRLLYALHDRLVDHTAMVYKIRNGKTFVKEVEYVEKQYKAKYDAVYENLLNNINLAGTKVKYPSGIDYVLPTSEKQFVGNIPSGSYVDIPEDFVAGIYWENDWGANDLDLSGVALSKVGWNASYNQSGLMYSGDNTSAPNGATECLYVKGELALPHLLMVNLYYGTLDNPKFRFFVAQQDGVSMGSYRDCMVDPNKVVFQTELVMEEGQKTLGIVIPMEKGNRFVLTNYNSGNLRVSMPSDYTNMSRDYLTKSFENRISLRQLLLDAGCEFVEENADIDLSVENLEKGTIMELFKPVPVSV